MLVLFSWTASGQPISRQIKGTDTTSTFTIEQERHIAYDLQLGLDCHRTLNALKEVDKSKGITIAIQKRIISNCDSSVHLLIQKDTANQSTIHKQTGVIHGLNKKVGFWKSTTYISIGLAIIFLLL
jgi:hypothetical protein